jgi:hypothetical protein
LIHSQGRKRADRVSSLVDAIIDYHCKTRTLPEYVQLLLSTVPSSRLPPQDLYRAASTSPFLAPHPHNLLPKAIHAFTTPGQVAALANSVIGAMQSLLSQLRTQDAKGEDQESPRKKRKTDAASPSGEARVDQTAVSFALTSRVAALVLVALPVHSLQLASFQQLQEELRSQVSSLVESALKQTSKRTAKNRDDGTWRWSVVGASMLWLQYDLWTMPESWLVEQSEDEDDSVKRLLKLATRETLEPELHVLAVSARTCSVRCTCAHPLAVPVADGISRHDVR